MKITNQIKLNKKRIKNEIRAKKAERYQNELERLLPELNYKQVRILDCVREKGSSNWLTALPIKEKGFHLAKSEFWDAICLRYGLDFKRMTTDCACGKAFTLEHGLSCMRGGYVSWRHDSIRDITAEFLSEVAKDVTTEPTLTALTGELFDLKTTNKEDEARLDIAFRNFWSKGTKAYCDIRVFNPLAKSYNNQKLSNAYTMNEKAKKREYNRRVIEVENSSFTPLIFTCYGGMGKECKQFYKHLAKLISEKREVPYSDVITFIRTKMSFSLLKSAILCIRGYRRRKEIDNGEKVAETDIQLTVLEAQLKEYN